MSRLAVLFVEDEPWVREGVAKALRAAEPTLGVTPCGTVRAAIAAIGRADFDAALVDLSLPDGKGTDVMVALRSRQPACVPLAFTKHDDAETILGALRLGARGYLLKSTPTDRIVAALHEALTGGLPLSPTVASLLVEQLLPSAPPRPTADAALTAREAEVLQLLARGDTYAACARTLGIGVGTVQSHVKAIYAKLEVSSKAEAALAAARLGLVT
jgi:DNA-binding NarL/FixJ family response regulator